MSKTPQRHGNTRVGELTAENVALVSRFYTPEVTADVIAEITAPDVVRDITPGLPVGAGGVYTGRDFGGALTPLH